MPLQIVGRAGGRYMIVGQGAIDPDVAELLASSGAVEASQEMIDARLGAGGLLVQETMPTQARCYPLGFDSGDPIDPGDTVAVNSQPQLTFRVERLIVPSDIAGSFVIDGFDVGKNGQFANSDISVPARIFDEQAVGVRLKGDTAQTSQNITLRVTNTSGAAVRFRAAIIGSAIE